MKRVFALAVLALAAVWTPAIAAEGIDLKSATAGDMAENCGANPREPGGLARINFCIGFAQGAIDVQMHYAGDKKTFCFPKPGPTREQTMSQFAAWVHAVPDRRPMPAAPALFKFLAERFPCK